MTLTDGVTELVENRYRSALSRQLPAVEDRAREVGQVFDAVQVAMRLGAWTSSAPLAADFLAGSEAQERAAASAADQCAADFRARRDGQPTRVERGDRRALWG